MGNEILKYLQNKDPFFTVFKNVDLLDKLVLAAKDNESEIFIGLKNEIDTLIGNKKETWFYIIRYLAMQSMPPTYLNRIKVVESVSAKEMHSQLDNWFTLSHQPKYQQNLASGFVSMCKSQLIFGSELTPNEELKLSSFAQIFALLNDGEYVFKTLSLLDKEIEDKEEGFALIHEAYLQDSFLISRATPHPNTVAPHPIYFKQGLLNDLLLELEQAHGINLANSEPYRPVDVYVGFVEKKDADESIQKGYLFNEISDLALFHGKYSHRLQFFIIMKAIDDGLIDISPFKGGVRELLADLVSERFKILLTSGPTEMWTRLIDQVLFSQVAQLDSTKLHEFTRQQYIENQQMPSSGNDPFLIHFLTMAHPQLKSLSGFLFAEFSNAALRIMNKTGINYETLLQLGTCNHAEISSFKYLLYPQSEISLYHQRQKTTETSTSVSNSGGIVRKKPHTPQIQWENRIPLLKAAYFEFPHGRIKETVKVSDLEAEVVKDWFDSAMKTHRTDILARLLHDLSVEEIIKIEPDLPEVIANHLLTYNIGNQEQRKQILQIIDYCIEHFSISLAPEHRISLLLQQKLSQFIEHNTKPERHSEGSLRWEVFDPDFDEYVVLDLDNIKRDLAELNENQSVQTYQFRLVGPISNTLMAMTLSYDLHHDIVTIDNITSSLNQPKLKTSFYNLSMWDKQEEDSSKIVKETHQQETPKK